MRLKKIFLYKILVLLALLSAGCSRDAGRPANADMPFSRAVSSASEAPQTTFPPQTAAETTAPQTTIPPVQTETTSADTTTAPFAPAYDFSARRSLLAQNDLWSAQFRQKPMSEKLALLKTLFPEGFYWNNKDSSSVNSGDAACLRISKSQCIHSGYGTSRCNGYSGVLANFFNFGSYNIQCLGFASMISDILYGKDAKVVEFSDYNALEVGDTVRLLAYDHSAVVIEKTDSYITVAESNRDYEHCKITWGRQINRSAFSRSARFFRRIPAAEETAAATAATSPPPTTTAPGDTGERNTEPFYTNNLPKHFYTKSINRCAIPAKGFSFINRHYILQFVYRWILFTICIGQIRLWEKNIRKDLNFKRSYGIIIEVFPRYRCVGPVQ